MTFDEKDNQIYKILKNKWGKRVERRDYRELEKKEPYLKGKGKTSGLMFLVDVTDDLP